MAASKGAMRQAQTLAGALQQRSLLVRPSVAATAPLAGPSRMLHTVSSASWSPAIRARSTFSEPRMRASHGFVAPHRSSFARFASTSGASSSSSSGSGSSSSSSSTDADEDGSSQPSLRQRLRYLWKRYGWWAFGVYNLWSLVDFSLTWAVIHLYGADHIRDVETRARKWVGLDKREATDEEVAKWPLALAGAEEEEGGIKRHMNNEEATKEVARKVVHEVKQHNPKGSSASNAGSTLWAEAVLAYTIHKTLLLPFRVMGTGAITPSFVNWMVRLGWAKPLPPIGASAAVASSGATKAAEGGAKATNMARKQ